MSTNRNDSRDATAPHAIGHGGAAPPKRPKRALAAVQSVLRSVPTVLVLVALGGVAYWGHRNDWRAPKFASLFGSPPERAPEDWCAEHNVPDSRCIKCHPELLGESAKDWCKEHGVPESRCTICHPEILTKGVAGDWCKEHGVPESVCTRCNAELIDGFKKKGDWCAKHDLPDSQCLVCHPELKAKFEALKPKGG